MERHRAGILSTLGAYTFWGLTPIYWKLVEAVPATQLLAHRIIWSALLLGSWSAVERRGARAVPGGDLGAGRPHPGRHTALIAVNWLTFIWAMTTDRILDASLGYFINPLVTVLLAMLFLRERLTRGRWISMALAGAGVAILALRVGNLPWIALVLAASFAFYGLLRKTVRAEPEVGLLVETVLLSPWMILLLVRADAAGTDVLGHEGLAMNLLLVASGVVTALPLLLFTHGARRLPLATVGFFQYLAPSMQFLLAVGVYGETFTLDHLAAFVLIWCALALFTWDARRQRRAARALAR